MVERQGRDSADYLRGIIERWENGRRQESAAFSLRGFRNFAEFMNKETRELIAFCGRENPEFYSALAELAVNAQAITTKGAKIMADHRDVTNL